jgi:NADPH:quinone reductase-like Zn-dependent oxidoreductase
MKEAYVNPDLSVEIKDVAMPEPGPGQVLIKVVVSGSNPKDWYVIPIAIATTTPTQFLSHHP